MGFKLRNVYYTYDELQVIQVPHLHVCMFVGICAYGCVYMKGYECLGVCMCVCNSIVVYTRYDNTSRYKF